MEMIHTIILNKDWSRDITCILKKDFIHNVLCFSKNVFICKQDHQVSLFKKKYPSGTGKIEIVEGNASYN